MYSGDIYIDNLALYEGELDTLRTENLGRPPLGGSVPKELPFEMLSSFYFKKQLQNHFLGASLG